METIYTSHPASLQSGRPNPFDELSIIFSKTTDLNSSRLWASSTWCSGSSVTNVAAVYLKQLHAGPTHWTVFEWSKRHWPMRRAPAGTHNVTLKSTKVNGYARKVWTFQHQEIWRRISPDKNKSNKILTSDWARPDQYILNDPSIVLMFIDLVQSRNKMIWCLIVDLIASKLNIERCLVLVFQRLIELKHILYLTCWFWSKIIKDKRISFTQTLNLCRPSILIKTVSHITLTLNCFKPSPLPLPRIQDDCISQLSIIPTLQVEHLDSETWCQTSSYSNMITSGYRCLLSMQVYSSDTHPLPLAARWGSFISWLRLG